MRIVLIENSCPDTRALGVRSLSSYCRAGGHDARIIFLPPVVERMSTGVKRLPPYRKSTMNDVISICRGADLVGISVLSYYYDLAVQVTRAVQTGLDLPVIWGGYHPMGTVSSSLEIADLIGIGEGEQMLVDLLNAWSEGHDGLATRNLAYPENGGIHQNDVRPLIQNLDSLPFLDYRLNAHYVMDTQSGRLVPLDRGQALRLSRMGPLSRLGPHHHYQTFMSRGCPYHCAYCCENMIHAIYRGQKYLRRRSPESLVAELECNLRENDYVDAIAFSDDSFSEASDDEIERFAAVYRSRINLPFSGQFSPITLSERKLKALLDAGLKYVEVGIQTGSERTKKMYHRSLSNDKILKTCGLLNRNIGRLLPPDYHFIVDNPWESTSDLIDTLNLVTKIPRPRGIKVSSLIFYPGTELYEKARAENRIGNEIEQVYRKNFGALSPAPANLIFFLSDLAWFPGVLLKPLIKPWILNRRGPLSRTIVSIAVSGIVFVRRALGKIRRILKRSDPS
ncbi:radical SAM protein [bacterium]|nr:radical SAM protein [candidate division CSSED10-310 bacterium]